MDAHEQSTMSSRPSETATAGRDPTPTQERHFQNRVRTDVMIVCGSKTFGCRRIFLRSRCEFFKVATEGPLKPGKVQRLYLPDDDPDAMEILLYWLHTLHVDTKILKEDLIEGADLVGVVYVTAAKYGVTSLQEYVRKQILKITRCLFDGWDSFTAEVRKLIAHIVINWWEDCASEETGLGDETLQRCILYNVSRKVDELLEDDYFVDFMNQHLAFPRRLMNTLMNQLEEVEQQCRQILRDGSLCPVSTEQNKHE